VAVDVNCKQAQQLVEGAIDGHVSALKLGHEHLYLFEESGIGLEQGRELFADEKDRGL
jgi:hypothetical protein